MRKIERFFNKFKPVMVSMFMTVSFSCSKIEEQVSYNAGYLGQSYEIKFATDYSRNFLSPTLSDIKAARGCQFEAGTQIEVTTIFESTGDNNFAYVFLFDQAGECKLKHGVIDKRTIINLPQSTKNYFALPVKKKFSTKVFSSKGSHDMCNMYKGEMLLSKVKPTIASNGMMEVEVLANKLDCVGGKSYLEVDAVDTTGINLSKTSKTEDDTYDPIIPPRVTSVETISDNGFDRKINAFLDAVAYAEGTKSNYNYSFTFKIFSDFSDHPRQIYCSGSLCSDAAGRYQFLSTTWDGVARSLGLRSFEPVNQDIAAVELLKRRKAYSLIKNIQTYGDFQNALYKCSLEWASLPGSPYGQPVKSASVLWEIYLKSLNK